MQLLIKLLGKKTWLIILHFVGNENTILVDTGAIHLILEINFNDSNIN